MNHECTRKWQDSHNHEIHETHEIKKTATLPYEKMAFVVHPLLNGRTADLPCGRAHARHPRTAFSSLLPIPYEKLAFVVLPTRMDAWQNCRAGAPTRAIHALPSPPSSLLPVSYPTEAHCIVSTHYLLLPIPYSLFPIPYSLLFFLFGGKVRRDVYIRRPYTCVAGCTVRYRPSTIIEFVPVPNPMRAGFSRHVLDRLRRWLICHTARHGRD